MLKTPKNRWKLANINREFLQIFWTIWGNSIKFSGNMCLKIILKVTKNQGFTLSLDNTFFEKPQGGGGQGGKLTPHPHHHHHTHTHPSRFRVKKNLIKLIWSNKNVSNFAVYIVKFTQFIKFRQINLTVHSSRWMNMLLRVLYSN